LILIRSIFQVLALVLSLAGVVPLKPSSVDAVITAANGTESEMVVAVPEGRSFVFRPLIATRERNRDIEKFLKRLKEQRRRYKKKNSSRRGPAGAVRK